jgi:hypothetical protein
MVAYSWMQMKKTIHGRQITNYLAYFFFLISKKTFPQITFRHLGNWVKCLSSAVFCGQELDNFIKLNLSCSSHTINQH